MFRAKKLRKLLEARINEARTAGHDAPMAQRVGRQRFVNEIRADLGVLVESRDGETGRVTFTESVDEYDRPTLAEGRARPEEFSLRQLAEAIFGDSFERYFDPHEGFDGQTALLEAGPGIDPTAFLNINTFSLATSGLVEAKVLENFENPIFIGDNLVDIRPTRLNGEKMIRTSGIGNKAQTRAPGEPHPRAGFGEEWIETPELVEKALAVEVQQEAVFYDLTGTVLDKAGSVGEELGYLRELTIIDLVEGVANPYKYNGTAYNTYQTSTPWINSHTNAMVDHTDFQASRELFREMTDPVTGKEILVIPNTMLIHSARVDDFFRQMNATEVRETTNTNTVTISPQVPSVTDGRATLFSSPIVDNRRTASDGLNLSEANAKVRWLHGDPKRAFMWMEAWPIRVRQASATEYVMLDRGLIAAYFANYRGVGAVREPRYMVANTN